MKIAICISGQLRNWQKCYDSLLSQFKSCDVDIFISTWNSTFESLRHNRKRNRVELDNEYIQKVIDTYKPKAYEFENHSAMFELINESKLKALRDTGLAHNRYPMYYKIWRTNELRKQSDVSYDLVVRTRFDMLFHNQILYDKLNPRVLYFGPGYKKTKDSPPYAAWKNNRFSIKTFNNISKRLQLNDTMAMNRKFPSPILNDQFAISGPKIMDLYSNSFMLYLHWLQIPKIKLPFTKKLANEPEAINYQVWRNCIFHQMMNVEYSLV